MWAQYGPTRVQHRPPAWAHMGPVRSGRAYEKSETILKIAVCAGEKSGDALGYELLVDLKKNNSNIEIIGVDAYGSVLKKYHETKELDTDEIYPYRIEGLGKNLIPSATDFESIDTFIKVTDEDSAHTAREVTRKEGLFVGYTSGAAMQAVKQLNLKEKFNDDSCVVIIFPDHGSRYMSKIYSDDWMNEQGFFDSTNQEAPNKIEYI